MIFNYQLKSGVLDKIENVFDVTLNENTLTIYYEISKIEFFNIQNFCWFVVFP